MFEPELAPVAVARCVEFWGDAAAAGFSEEAFAWGSPAQRGIGELMPLLSSDRKPLIQAVTASYEALLAKLQGSFVPSMAWVATLAEFTILCFPATRDRVIDHFEELLSLSADSCWSLRNCAALVAPFTAAVTALLDSLPRDDLWPQAGNELVEEIFYNNIAEVIDSMGMYLECMISRELGLKPAQQANLRRLLDPKLDPDAFKRAFTATVGIFDAAIRGRLLPTPAHAYVSFILQSRAIMSIYSNICDENAENHLRAALADPRWASLVLDSAERGLDEGDDIKRETIALFLPQLTLHLTDSGQGEWGGHALLAASAARQRLLALPSLISSKLANYRSRTYDPATVFLNKVAVELVVATVELRAPERSAADVYATAQLLTDLADSLISLFTNITLSWNLFNGPMIWSFDACFHTLEEALKAAGSASLQQSMAPDNPDFDASVRAWLLCMERWLSLAAILSFTVPQIMPNSTTFAAAANFAFDCSSRLAARFAGLLTANFRAKALDETFWTRLSPETLQLFPQIFETMGKAAAAWGPAMEGISRYSLTEINDYDVEFIKTSFYSLELLLSTAWTSENGSSKYPAAILTLLHMILHFPADDESMNGFLQLILSSDVPLKDYVYAAELPALETLRAAVPRAPGLSRRKKTALMTDIDAACAAAATPDASKSAEHHARRALALAHSRRCSHLGCQTVRGSASATIESKICNGCHVSHYCSREDQRADWRLGHKYACRALAARGSSGS